MSITTRTVTGTLYGPGDTPVGGGMVRFMLSAPDIEDSTVILPRPIDVTVGVDATFSASLWVNSVGSNSTHYTMSGASRSEFQFTLTPGSSIDIIGLINSVPVLSIDTSTGQAHVTGSAVSPVTSYVLEMSINGGAYSTVQSPTSPSTIDYTTIALSDGTSVSFRAKSIYNGVSSAWSSIVSGTVQAPATPVLSLTMSGTDAHLTTTATARATSYKVYRKTGLGGTYALLKTVSVSAGAALDTHDTTGAAGTTYYFKVSASNTAGDSAFSNEIGGATERGPNLLIHLLVTGQSNGDGVNAMPLLSTSQPYSNKMFNAGTRPGGSSLTSFISLVESSRTDPVDGSQTDGETILSAMTSWLAENLDSPPGQGFLGSVVAVSGARYTALKKTTTPYSNSIAQATAAQSIANTNGWDLEAYPISIHGEADQSFNDTAYGSTEVPQWQSDYQTDIQAITDQLTVPLFMCQQNGSSPSQATTQPNASSVGGSTAYQLEKAARDNPGEIILVGPRYQYDYVDTLHLTNHAQRWHGEMYAKVIKHVLFDGLIWTPFSPSSAILVGSTITIDFDVPVAPLVFDPAMVFNPGNYGFEFYDDSGSTPAITGVAITGSAQVTITLASAPTGTVKQIRYAHTKASSVTSAGKFAGGRGCLRDSDSATSRYDYPLYNWCCHFVRNV